MDEKPPNSVLGGRSHLGIGSHITGKLIFPGTVELPGYVNGSVDAATIVVEETGEVEGDLRGESIAIKGQFTGQIVGGKVMLHASAHVTGEIIYESLSIESGAKVSGRFSSSPFVKEANNHQADGAKDY